MKFTNNYKFFFIATLITFLALRADNVSARVNDMVWVDNIYYKILSEDDSTAAVVNYSSYRTVSYVYTFDIGEEGKLEIPEYVNLQGKNYHVVKLGNYEPEYYFNISRDVKKLVIPSSVSEIETDIFNGTLQHIDISEGNKNYFSLNGEIYNYEWEKLFTPKAHSYKLYNKFVIPEGVTFLPDSLFAGNERMLYVECPSTLKRIGNHCFKHCNYLKQVILKSELEEIGDMAFFECPKLKEIRSDFSPKRVGKTCFMNCTSLLSSFNIIGSESVGIQSYYGCKKIQDVILPEGLESCGTWAFGNCDDLHNIVLPASFNPTGSRIIFPTSSWPLERIYSLNSEISRMEAPVTAEQATPVYIPQGTLEWYQTKPLNWHPTPFAPFDDNHWWWFTNYYEITEPSAIISVGELPLTFGEDFRLNGWCTLEAGVPCEMVYTSEWVSDDQSVAEVDQTGIVTPVSQGITNIRYLVFDINDDLICEAECKVNVHDPMGLKVDEIASDSNNVISDTTKIFTLQGVFVGDDLNQLPKGIYIITTSKYTKKVFKN